MKYILLKICPVIGALFGHGVASASASALSIFRPASQKIFEGLKIHFSVCVWLYMEG
tara:strand:- start:139 stop:309 length:171 start_codon:yes stop_codon:yes gene_type:complete